MARINFLLPLFIVSPLFAQSDDLTDRQKVAYINENFYKIYSDNLAESLKLTQWAAETARKNRWQRDEAYALLGWGVVSYLAGDYRNALPCYLEALELFEKLNDNRGITRVCNAIIIDVSFAFPFVDMKTASSNLAGFSSVKAKIDFELGTAFGMDGATPLMAPTQIKFVGSEGMGKDAILFVKLKEETLDSAEPVFKDKKFKESNVAMMDYRPNYYGIIWKEEQQVKVSHYAECDGALYKQETKRLGSEFMDQALRIFYSNALK
jgi:tetratricopeptide (TPR) repeat protein